jgi:MFS family permease
VVGQRENSSPPDLADWTRMPELSQRRRLGVLAICCASMVVVVMDISIVNVALPAMRRDLHASVSGLQWTVDAYTLVLASFLVLAGSLADRVGRRRIFLAGLAAFGLGSLLCGLAPGIGALIGARALQAAGGTMLNPVAMAIIASTFPGPAERARAIGVFGSVSGLSLGLGPVLIVVLGLLSTGRRACGTAARAAALFAGLDPGDLARRGHGRARAPA